MSGASRFSAGKTLTSGSAVGKSVRRKDEKEHCRRSSASYKETNKSNSATGPISPSFSWKRSERRRGTKGSGGPSGCQKNDVRQQANREAQKGERRRLFGWENRPRIARPPRNPRISASLRELGRARSLTESFSGAGTRIKRGKRRIWAQKSDRKRTPLRCGPCSSRTAGGGESSHWDLVATRKN